MAVNKVPGNSVLRLAFQVGENPNGEPVIRNRSISGIKPGAADQDLFDVANALAGLQQFPLSGVYRVDNSALVNA